MGSHQPQTKTQNQSHPTSTLLRKAANRNKNNEKGCDIEVPVEVSRRGIKDGELGKRREVEGGNRLDPSPI